MTFYSFDSRNLVKEFDKNKFINKADFSENEFFFKRSYWPFTMAILFEYLKFFVFRFFVFDPTKRTFLRRNEYGINLFFKHILIVEWGVYNIREGMERNVAEKFMENRLSFKSFRSDCIYEYNVSHYDLATPIHRTAFGRYYFGEKKLPSRDFKFFFQFNVILPFNCSGYFSTDIFGYKVISPLNDLPPPPFLVSYPLLFEFFLLKFNLFSFIFSTHYSHIYSFYNGDFFESIFFRFKRMLHIIFEYNLGRIWKEKEIPLYQVGFFNIKLNYYALRSFYSKSTLTSHFMHSLFYYNSLKSVILKHNSPFKWQPLIYAIISVSIFFFFFVFTSAEHINLFFSSSFREQFSFFLTSFIGYFIFYVAVLHYVLIYLLNFQGFIRIRVSKELWSSILKFYSWFYYFSSTIFFLILEILFIYFVNFFLFLALLHLFEFSFFNEVFEYIIFSSFILFFFNFLSKFDFILNGILFGYNANSTFSYKYTFFPPFIHFLALVYIIFFFFLVFFINTFLMFFFLLKNYMPSVNFTDKNYLRGENDILEWSLLGCDPNFIPKKSIYIESAANFLRVPFLRAEDYFLVICQDRRATSRYLKHLRLLYPYINYPDTYYFKFLIDRKNRIFEIQYNNFNYELFLKNNRGYLSRSITFLPHPLIHFLMLIDLYFLFCLIYLKSILYFNFLDLGSFFCSIEKIYPLSFYVNKLSDFFARKLFLYRASTRDIRYTHIFFNSNNLRQISFKLVDSAYYF